MTYFDTLKKGLADPEAKGIYCIVPRLSVQVRAELAKFPNAKYISEWRNESGRIRYEYHMHDERLGLQLMKLKEENNVGKHPQLTAVYLISELESILA